MHCFLPAPSPKKWGQWARQTLLDASEAFYLPSKQSLQRFMGILLLWAMQLSTQSKAFWGRIPVHTIHYCTITAPVKIEDCIVLCSNPLVVKRATLNFSNLPPDLQILGGKLELAKSTRNQQNGLPSLPTTHICSHMPRA